eukprot:36110_1
MAPIASVAHDIMYDEIDNLEGRVLRAALNIVDHNEGQIKVRWELVANSEIVESWEQLEDMKHDITQSVVEYGLQNELQDHPRWEWIQEYIRVVELRRIVSHQEDNDRMIFNAVYEDGFIEERTLNEMKEDAPDLLYRYANENNLLHQWRTEYIRLSMGNNEN